MGPETQEVLSHVYTAIETYQSASSRPCRNTGLDAAPDLRDLQSNLGEDQTEKEKEKH